MDVDLRRTLAAERAWAMFNMIMFAVAIVASVVEVATVSRLIMSMALGLGASHWMLRVHSISRLLDGNSLRDR